MVEHTGRWWCTIQNGGGGGGCCSSGGLMHQLPQLIQEQVEQEVYVFRTCFHRWNQHHLVRWYGENTRTLETVGCWRSRRWYLQVERQCNAAGGGTAGGDYNYLDVMESGGPSGGGAGALHPIGGGTARKAKWWWRWWWMISIGGYAEVEIEVVAGGSGIVIIRYKFQ